MNALHRRQFLKRMGFSMATLPFIVGLPSLGLASPVRPRQRLIVMFSPNGTIPPAFWPEETGSEFKLKEIMSPLEAYKDRMLILHGISNRVRGRWRQSHARHELPPHGASNCFRETSRARIGHAGRLEASGISIDQEIKDYLQSREETRTRFGSLEFGVGVTDRADPWTRMSYAGPNKPVAPISDPYQMYQKLYGQLKDKASLKSILDDVQDDLKKSSQAGQRRRSSPACWRISEALVRNMEKEIAAATSARNWAVRPALVSRKASPIRMTTSPRLQPHAGRSPGQQFRQ